jgi:ABC-2 type transport system ATP-binding protein
MPSLPRGHFLFWSNNSVVAALEFREVTKEYASGVFRKKRFRALDGFSVAVEPGEIFGFLGPNGAGKTTAIHIALGLAFATSGNGSLLGQPFGNARVRQRVGFLAENVSFYNLPAAQLIRFYGGLNGVHDPQLSQRTKKILEDLDLSEVSDKPVGKFSRGMLQRIGLAQALVNDPELLILDEPTSALDPAARVAVREMLLAAKRSGKTVFLSSHLLSEVELVCDRIGIIHRGRLVKVGRTPELLESRAEFEITARRVRAEQIGARAMEDGLVAVTVPAAGQRATVERVWAAGGEIVSIAPVRKSLEEVFLSLTREEGER